MAYTWDKANANAPSSRTTQYFEIFGNRAIYHDGWIACTTPPAGPWLMGTTQMPDVVNGYNWELYNISEDYSESNDLAKKMPDKLNEMKELFMAEAARNNVLPLDNSILPRILSPKPSYTAGRTLFSYNGPINGIATSNSPNILAKSFSITATIDVPQGGGDGMLVTEGGYFGGYGFYILKGKPTFTYNLLAMKKFRWQDKDVLSAGKHTLTFDFAYEGPGFGKGGTGVMSVDGKEVARQQIPHTIPVIMTLDETFDIGSDTKTGVNDSDYKVPFIFNGKINNLSVQLKP
jgi:arylsulfatase